MLHSVSFTSEEQVREVIDAWSTFLTDPRFDWHALVDGVEPKNGSCGHIYELGNPLNRSNEDFSIADMRELQVADPHYHLNDETEIYIVIQGTGMVVVGNEPREVGPSDVVVTFPGTAHYTIPHDQLVLGVVNTPAFEATNYVSLKKRDPAVRFDADLFAELAERKQDNQLADLLRELTLELNAWASVLLVAGVRPDRLVCRARYKLPLEWAVYGNFLDSGSLNATAFNRQTELIDNNVTQNLPPSPTAASVQAHKMTASAVVLLPHRMGTLECLSDVDGYVFDETKMALMRSAATSAAKLL